MAPVATVAAEVIKHSFVSASAIATTLVDMADRQRVFLVAIGPFVAVLTVATIAQSMTVRK